MSMRLNSRWPVWLILLALAVYLLGSIFHGAGRAHADEVSPSPSASASVTSSTSSSPSPAASNPASSGSTTTVTSDSESAPSFAQWVTSDEGRDVLVAGVLGLGFLVFFAGFTAIARLS